MEIILAIVVVTAVIFFGALISIGNERQRRAIDELHEDIIHWAEQDLLIKRERLAMNAHVPDPLKWFGRLASKVVGVNLKLENAEFIESQSILRFSVEQSTEKVLFTPISPAEIRRLKANLSRKTLRDATVNPMFALPRGVITKQLMLSNGGFMFDLELPLAWKSLTNREIEHGKELWLYFYAGDHL